jgi:hypothetical protein
MPVTAIKELLLLPPLAIARFGSSQQPLENYQLKLVDPYGFRKILPAPTLIVDPGTGAISRETTPDPNGTVTFRDEQGRVKPLAPFLEVWARFEDNGAFEPLTRNHLADLGLKPWDVKWTVQVANIKVYRRTGHVNDQVRALVRIDQSADSPDLHAAQPLTGTSPNFKPTATGTKTIPLGQFRYIRPTDAFPEIRARFTPGQGRVYGCRADDPLITDDVYAGVTSIPAARNGNWAYPFAGVWDRYWIGAPNTPPVTAPGDIFQGQFVGDTKVSDGYLDDTCDGIVEVRLTVGQNALRAAARIMSGVPDFAPDSFHVRTIADDLEQMAFGPDVPAPASSADKEAIKTDVIDIIRRAYETVRLMNTQVQNGTQNIGGVAVNRNNMTGQQNGSYGRAMEPFFPRTQAAYRFALAAHQAALKQAIESPTLEGSFPAFDLMRQPDQVANLQTTARRHMPAMMRGSDSLELALTWRQLAKLRLASAAAAPGAAPALAVLPAVVTGAVLPRLRGRLPVRTKSVPSEP